jgi:hypothetical protein
MKRTFGLLVISAIGVESGNLAEVFESAKVDGYLRGTYQSHNVKDGKTYEDDALGGKLHIETGAVSGVSAGASFYTSNAVFNNDNKGLVPLRGESYKSYSILGEAYLKAEFGKSMLTVGRQEIETPFAQVDDIGMVPNTFEAAVFESKEIQDISIFLGQVQKMAGVDAPSVDNFKKINGSKNVQVLGLTYEGMSDLTLAGWYYNLRDGEVNKITYLEVDYEKELGEITYGVGLQYANQGYSVGETAKVYGGTFSATINKLGLTVATAYTEVHDNAATSGFGGGPFFSNSEYLILDNAGKDGKATWFGAEYDASHVGLKGLVLGLGHVTLENESSKKARELDLTLSYEVNEATEIHLIASNLKGANVGEDDAKHLRVFANYNF